MNNDYTFRYENDVPVALIGAFGQELPEEIPLSRMATINTAVSEALENFLDESRKATDSLLGSLPENDSEKAYALAMIQFQLLLHEQESGETVAFISPGQAGFAEPEKEFTKSTKEHMSLAEQHAAYRGGLSEDDLNRVFLILACENYVLQELERVGNNREKLDITPQMLWARVRSELGFAPDEWMEVLVPILIQDGWVLFNHPKTGGTNLLPYGFGIPSYDEELAIEHPMWWRDYKIPVVL